VVELVLNLAAVMLLGGRDARGGSEVGSSGVAADAGGDAVEQVQ
jgi:hypothetical protein